MIYYLIFISLFVNVVLSLRCKTSSPANCIYNVTCIYNTIECSSSSLSSTIRGGTYCTTIIQKSDQISVGRMDCMYDQETRKTCKNQTQCYMEYTNDQKQFLHCCCDQDFCNLNFSLLNIDRPTPSPPPPSLPTTDLCKGLLCKPIYLIILCFIIAFILLLITISFIYRNNLFKSFEKCGGLINKSPTNKTIIQPETLPFLTNQEQIDFNHLIIGNIIKRGRFSSIHQGIYNNNRVAIKILIDENGNDEPKALFEHEKEIYSLPLMNHINILKYYGYSKYVDKLCLITELSENGSLQDVLRSRLLKDEKELILILKQISEGVQYLHNEYRNDNELIRPSIAHRDLKCENILYINENRLVICDFAMATKLEQNQNDPNEQQQIGTPRYMSPEILAGTIGCGRDALLQCDVYALAIIYWQLLSRYPFQDSNENFCQPFEKQLIDNKLNVNNPSVSDMLRIIDLPNPSNRPLINQSWRNLNKQWLNQIITTMEECWEQTPEARISSALAARRIQQLTI